MDGSPLWTKYFEWKVFWANSLWTNSHDTFQQWASLIEVLDLADHHVRIAAHPCCYTFLSTDPLPNAGLNEQTPVFICMDENTYICPTESRTICGGFVEHALKSLTPLTHTKSKRPDWHVPPANWDIFSRF